MTATATPGRDRRKPYSFTIKGRVAMPTGVSNASGCTGQIRISAKRGTKSLGTKTGNLKRDCTYSVKISIKTKGAVKFTARFLGNSLVKAKSSPVRNARAG